MAYRNLVPGQYQLGNIVMGKGTNIKIEFDVKPADINNQDYQVVRSDETRFGLDAFKPTTIEMQLDVLNNYLLPDYVNDIPNYWHGMPSQSDLAYLWRNDDYRNVWGAMVPLYCCGKDGIGKMIFGRPGQFASQHETEYSEWVTCIGEFRRADTLAYSVVEYGAELTSNADPDYLIRTLGDNVDTWLRIVLEGPITNPVITIGEYEIKLVDTTIAADELVEISTYPWQRRIINNKRVNLAQKLSGTTPYLDKIRLPYGVPVPVRWTSDDFNTFVPALGNQVWGVDINDLGYTDLPATFTAIHGRPVIRFDLFNKTGHTTYIASGLLTNTIHACLYASKSFNTQNQYSQARITEPFPGRSAIVIMSNDTMTNFMALEIESFALSHGKMHLTVGNGYNSTVRKVTYDMPGFWDENQDVGIGYDPATNTFQGYLNGDPIDGFAWVDTGNLVNKANRRQGYLFNMGAETFNVGTGFQHLVNYDRATVPADTGKAYIFWRDAWLTV